MVVHQAAVFKVPRSRTGETHRALRDEIAVALEQVLLDPLGGADAVREGFERELAAVMGQGYACAVNSGTIGLFLALRGCGVGPGDEVITVGNSDVSTTAAISHCGAIPVLCDVRESDYTIDPDLVSLLVTDRTAAIVPVDLYGYPADVKPLRPIADRHGLKIVEDAALAAGATDYGQPLGAYADATVVSFAPFKPLGSAGNGGVVLTNDDEIAHRVRLLCSYGHARGRSADIPGQQMHVAEGFNVPIDPLEAALLRVKLPYLAGWTKRRQAIAQAYAVGLRNTGAILPAFRPASAPTFRSYTIRVQDQQGVFQALLRGGIEAVLHYAPPVYRQPVYAANPLRGADRLPITDRITREIVCLPVAPELDDDDVAHVVATLRATLGASG